MNEEHNMNLEDLGTYYESILDKEVRKERGIYYTPSPIVDYMVENTLGELLKSKTQEEAAKIKIVDPACGGGVFLLGAYQFLLDWHEKHFGKLTQEKRHNILADNIFGVDIDPLAVEITKYCLSMKCSEGKDFSLDLGENIHCGNSLIETEFNWHRAFPYVFQQGGFDIVIGNPPYGAEYPAEHKKYFKEHYQSAKTIKRAGNCVAVQKGSMDTFSLFIENGFNNLKESGYLLFIVPLSVISSDSMTALHALLEKHCSVIKVASFCDRPQQIFRHSHKKTTIIGFRKDNQKNKHIYATQMYRKDKNTPLESFVKTIRFIDVAKLGLNGRYAKISLPVEKRILKKLFAKGHTPIRDLIDADGKPIYYRSTGGMYYNVVTNKTKESTKEKSLYFDKKFTDVIGAVLSSSLFWWYQQVYTNGLDIKSYEIESFPIPMKKLTPAVRQKIEKLYKRYLCDIERHVIEHETQEYKHVTQFKEYKIRYSKPLIDEIDDLIAPLYGLTDEERDFIKNYEIKFRVDDLPEGETQ